MHGWRKEGKNESVKSRRERSQKWAKRGRKIKHRPQNLLEKGAKIDQNRAKIDPKGSQNEDKTDKKLKQPRQDDLGPPWVTISRLSCAGQVPFWVPNRAKFVKKSDAKIIDFLSALEAKKVRKTSPKPFQNGAQDGLKSNPEGRSGGKWEKCKNEQHSMVWPRVLITQGGPKSKGKSTVRKCFEIGMHFRRWFLKEFGRFSRPSWDPRWSQEGFKIDVKFVSGA